MVLAPSPATPSSATTRKITRVTSSLMISPRCETHIQPTRELARARRSKQRFPGSQSLFPGSQIPTSQCIGHDEEEGFPSRSERKMADPQVFCQMSIMLGRVTNQIRMIRHLLRSHDGEYPVLMVAPPGNTGITYGDQGVLCGGIVHHQASQRGVSTLADFQQGVPGKTPRSRLETKPRPAGTSQVASMAKVGASTNRWTRY